MATLARALPMVMTVDEYLAYPEVEGEKVELVRGELSVSPPPSVAHGGVSTNLVLLLGAHAHPAGLGRVFGDNVGYELVQLPRTVRVPDASFVRADQLRAQGLRGALFKFAPDLAVEVLSPSETASSLEEKLDDYRAAGTRLIWIADPRRRTVMVVSDDEPVRILHEDDALTGGRVLPDFTCGVTQVFEGIPRDLESSGREDERP